MIEQGLANLKQWHVEVGDVLSVLRRIPDGVIHCCVSSPPYWGLRDYQVDGQIGLEKTPEEFIAKLVEVFGEVRRVLRDDGTCWVNMGDNYANDSKWGGQTSGKHAKYLHGQSLIRAKKTSGLKAKDLVMMPAQLAIALRNDGWYLRSEITWCKKSPMPGPVRDRPTTATEKVYLLSKQPTYFYDQDAERVPQKTAGERHEGKSGYREDHPSKGGMSERSLHPAGRNLWNYWTDIGQSNFKKAHFATFPPDLPARCIRLGTSERGVCPECGTQWERIVEKERKPTRPGTNSKVKVPSGWDTKAGSHGTVHREGRTPEPEYRDTAEIGNRDPGRHVTETRMVGWEPGCQCGSALDPIGAIVLDPFSGAATTGLVAVQMGRRYLGIELNPEYAAMGDKRIRNRNVAPAPTVAEARGQRLLWEDSQEGGT